MDSRAVSFGGMAGNAASEQDLALAQYALDLKARQEAADSAERRAIQENRVGLLADMVPSDLPRDTALRAYKPTWRDRIAQAMIGDDRPSEIRRRVVEGLMGSSGLGSPGLSVVDFVPGGQVFAMQDAAAAGDMQGAALAIVPLAGRANIAPNNIIRHTGRDVPRYGAGPGPTVYSELAENKHRIPVEEMSAGVIPRGEFVQRRDLDPQKMQGGTLIKTVGDRTRSDATLVEVNGNPLAFNVHLPGGPGYMQNPDATWAAAPGQMKYIIDQNRQFQESGKPVFLSYTAMGGRSGDFAPMTAETLLAQIPGSKILKKDIKEFDDAIRRLAPDWPGIEKTDAARKFLNSPKVGTKLRVPFVEEMAQKKYQEAGFPDIGSTRFAVHEPELTLAPPGTSGFNVSRLTPDTRILKDPPNPNPGYPADLVGAEYLGGLRTPFPRQIMYPDWTAQRRALGTLPKDDKRSFDWSANVVQNLDQKWLDNIMKWDEAYQAGRIASF
jgi:hypothetical protein